MFAVDTGLLLVVIVLALLVAVVLVLIVRLPARVQTSVAEPVTQLRGDLTANSAELRQEISGRLSQQALENEQKLDNLRTTIDAKLDAVRDTTEKTIQALTVDNAKQLDKMRETVDEKLQKTLEERIGKSFALVSAQLEQVHKGLGEIQLGAILEEILSPEQYEENISTKAGSSERVEFAIKLPGDESGVVYLPIDAKFPGDAYGHLVDAYELGDAAAVDAAGKLLDTAIKKAAKDISEKYVEPPHTTDFAIMFLPFEGLYAEVVRRGLIEELQSKYHINIAGPTTMAALLNSLQMGFKTLAIQKRSGEVWKVLNGVRVEFDKFADVLSTAQKRITMANDELDKLIGTRTNMIQRQLRNIAELPEGIDDDV
jgi:DNA recombination protein RmuC